MRTSYACSMGEGGEGFFTEWEDSYDSFDQMNLHENLLRGIYAYGEAVCVAHNDQPPGSLFLSSHWLKSRIWALLTICSLLPAGFEKPSAIQQKGIVPFAKGLDVIQQAQSGTGKTATFCAGILQNLDYNQLECQALVLAPTRELAQQIEKVMRALGDYLQVPSSSFAARHRRQLPTWHNRSVSGQGSVGAAVAPPQTWTVPCR